MVVNHVGEMVRGVSVRFKKHKVLFRVLLLKWSIDGIAELWSSVGVSFEAHDVSLAVSPATVRISPRD